MANVVTALPRVTIEFCTQCKWMLRAAYFAQELISTFSTSLGEVALQPSTGGVFAVHLYTAAPSSTATIQKHLLWDRKAEGGFPETKELKRRVRDIIDPSRDLGHVDSHAKPATTTTTGQAPPVEKVAQAGAAGDDAWDVVNENGKVVIGGGGEGESFGFCRPGDENCCC